jgi:hypothetical protein
MKCLRRNVAATGVAAGIHIIFLLGAKVFLAAYFLCSHICNAFGFCTSGAKLKGKSGAKPALSP